VLPLYPQRPKRVTRLLSLFERDGWVAQMKLNGSRCLVLRRDDSTVEFWSRHGYPFRRFRPTDRMLTVLRTLPTGTVLDGELLHFRTKTVKHKLAVFDILALRGELLLTVPQHERWAILADLIRPSSRVVNNRADVYRLLWYTDVRRAWKRALSEREDVVEGIVIKSMTARLRVGLKSAPNAEGWYKLRRCDYVGKTPLRQV